MQHVATQKPDKMQWAVENRHLVLDSFISAALKAWKHRFQVGKVLLKGNFEKHLTNPGTVFQALSPAPQGGECQHPEQGVMCIIADKPTASQPV